MDRAAQLLAPDTGRVLLPPSVTLAFQRMRQTWRLLSLVGLGMLAAVMVVCAVPLYSRVAMTAGLRSSLTAYGQNSDIVVRGSSNAISAGSVQQVNQSLNQEFQANLGPYLLSGQFSLQAPVLPILRPDSHGRLSSSGDQMGMIGVDTTRAGAHLHFVQGRMPGTTASGNTIEVAIRAETAAQLHWVPGTILQLRVVYFTQDASAQVPAILNLRVVGVFTLPKSDDPFWHGEDFLGSSPDTNTFVAGSLVSNDALLALLSQPPTGAGPVISTPSTLVWYYSLNASHIQIDKVDDILHGISRIQVDNANNSLLTQQANLQRVQTYLPTDSFTLYHERLPVVQFPVMSLTLLVLCLVLFFITLMTGILVDRQAASLALLRSRGASPAQIFWSLVTQAVVLGLIALLAGPLLSITLTRVLAQAILPNADQGALNVLAGNPLPLALSVGLFALVTAAVIVLTMILAIWSTASRDVLALRRETARSTHRPLWQRLNLDAFAVLAALVGAAFSFYLTNSNVLNPRLRLLFLSPLTLLEALCVLLAAMLLLLRGFPLLLNVGARLAARLRGASSLVALAQMARAPRQAVRMTLLLALATAFTIFTLVFNASQTQRIQDVAAFQAGADFSGNVPVALITPQHMAQATQAYAHLPGVLSASLGYTKVATAGGAQLSLPITFQAVDADTFAHTLRWSPAAPTEPLSSLMNQLTSARASSLQQGMVPAFVDATTWNELHLSPGAHFTLNFSVVGAFDVVNFKALGEVPQITTPGNSSIPEVLADYKTFVGVYTHNFTASSGYTVPLNYVWLRTSDDAGQLKTLRRMLSQSDLNLSPLYDRRQMVGQLANEPLYLTLFGILLLGTTTALLLALLGNLVASWLNARSRLANFATLRALGATPRQLAGTLGWEQVIIYSVAVLLGFLFGWLLAMLALPSLVFTSILPNQITGEVDSSTFYAAQNTPPITIVIPAVLWLVLGALILLCILALGMMVRVVSRPSIAQMLRLNED